MKNGDFTKIATRTFKNVIKDDAFTYVTLACGDDVSMEAHKVILSGSSKVLKKYSSKTPISIHSYTSQG